VELGLLGLDAHAVTGGVTRSMSMPSAFRRGGFVRATGAGWIAADVAGGEDASEATKRGQRTIHFYCGESFDHI
jgi:hypothetical protein